tara:strand:+ start:908 stop:1459 length:552 start_codon:yes stop_codon:yes gene_type:complete
MSDNERMTRAIIEVIAESMQQYENELNVPMERTTDTEGQCSICLENFDNEREIVQIPCQHKFHKDCIETWFETHSTCPMCRRNYGPEPETINRLEFREMITINTFNLHFDNRETFTTQWSFDSTPLDLFLYLRRTIRFSQTQHKLVLIFNTIIFTCNESLEYLVQSWRSFGIIGTFDISVRIF